MDKGKFIIAAFFAIAIIVASFAFYAAYAKDTKKEATKDPSTQNQSEGLLGAVPSWITGLFG